MLHLLINSLRFKVHQLKNRRIKKHNVINMGSMTLTPTVMTQLFCKT